MKSYRAQVLAILLCLGASTGWAQSRDLSFSSSCSKETVFISFVGDILVHDAIYKSIVQGSQKFSQAWKRTDSLIQKADFSVGNLEGPAAMGVDRNGRDQGDIGFKYDLDVYSGTNFSFNYHPRILTDLKKSGYGLLTVANNHSLDRGALGIDKTLDAAREINLPTVGTRRSDERNGDFHKIVSIKGAKVAFIGCTEMTNGRPDRKEQLLWCYRDANKIVDTIKELSSRSDIDAVIVLPHWGVEYSPSPDSQQKAHARRFLDAGASAIVGSHPHVLQPWEKYVTKDGRETVIMYSLGNFLAWQAGIEKKTSAVTYLALTPSSGKAKVAGVAYTTTIREGVEVYPVSSSGSRAALNQTGLHFGTKNRIEPSGSLSAQICGRAQEL